MTRIPRTEAEFSRWLGELQQTCEAYVRSYESARNQAEFAVGLIFNKYAARLRGLNASIDARHDYIGASNVGPSGAIVDLHVPIAAALYEHCLYRIGRAPGDLKVAKPAGAVALPGGLDLVSVLLGAAVGGIGMHFYMKR